MLAASPSQAVPLFDYWARQDAALVKLYDRHITIGSYNRAMADAQAQLAIAARLPVDDLGVLVVALLRLFQAEFPIEDIEADAVAAQTQKLRRLIPTGLMNELKPFALAIDPQRFRHTDLARDLKITGLRAGLIASGSLLAGLRILSSQVGGELPAFLADPLAQGLVSFALGEDHAAVAR